MEIGEATGGIIKMFLFWGNFKSSYSLRLGF